MTQCKKGSKISKWVFGADSCAASLTWWWSSDIWNREPKRMEFYFNEYNNYTYISKEFAMSPYDNAEGRLVCVSECHR